MTPNPSHHARGTAMISTGDAWSVTVTQANRLPRTPVVIEITLDGRLIAELYAPKDGKPTMLGFTPFRDAFDWKVPVHRGEETLARALVHLEKVRRENGVRSGRSLLR